MESRVMAGLEVAPYYFGRIDRDDSNRILKRCIGDYLRNDYTYFSAAVAGLSRYLRSSQDCAWRVAVRRSLVKDKWQVVVSLNAGGQCYHIVGMAENNNVFIDGSRRFATWVSLVTSYVNNRTLIRCDPNNPSITGVLINFALWPLWLLRRGQVQLYFGVVLLCYDCLPLLYFIF